MIPLPVSLPGRDLAGALIGVLAFTLAAGWWWQRRLTIPCTRTARERWYRRLAARPDGDAVEATASWWAALHDGFLSRRIARLAGRHQRSDARLRIAELRLRTAVALGAKARDQLTEMQSGSSAAGLGIPVALASILTLGSALADFVLVRDTFGAWLGRLDDLQVSFVALPIVAVMFLGGRQAAIGVLERSTARTMVGATIAVIAAWVVAAGDPYPGFRFTVALAPAVVSAVATGLAHRSAAALERAARRDHRSTRAASRRLDQFERRLTRCAGLQARLAAAAVGPLVARPHVGLDGVPAPITTTNVLDLLTEIGVIRDTDQIPRSYRLLRQLGTLDETDSPEMFSDDERPALRSVR